MNYRRAGYEKIPVIQVPSPSRRPIYEEFRPRLSRYERNPVVLCKCHSRSGGEELSPPGGPLVLLPGEFAFEGFWG